MNHPALSVVVTIVDGGAALRRCLAALAAQEHAPAMEVIVPFDATMPDVPSLVDEVRDECAGPSRPTFRCIALGAVPTAQSPASFAGQHELFDRRRAAGLAGATADIVGILEDRGVPRADWAASAVGLHERHAHAAIGGVVENGVDRVLNWAVYFCDFGRYQPPIPAGAQRELTDINVTYKRGAIDRVRDLWADRFHEPLVHAAIRADGGVLFLSPELVVTQWREGLSVPRLLAERFAWGLLFGALRCRDASWTKRMGWVAAAPIVPGVMFSRFLGNQRTRRAPWGRVVRVALPVALLLCAWAAGEAFGALRRRL